jgi:hypothetical protein
MIINITVEIFAKQNICINVQRLSHPPPTVAHTPTLAAFGKDGAPLFYTPIEFVTDLVAKLWYSMSKN